MTDSTFYNQVIQFVVQAQSQVGQSMVEGKCRQESAETTGLLYCEQYARVHQSQVIIDGIKSIWAKHNGEASQEPQPLKETAADGESVPDLY